MLDYVPFCSFFWLVSAMEQFTALWDEFYGENSDKERELAAAALFLGSVEAESRFPAA